MKQGGSTGNGSHGGRSMKSRVSCKHCGRSYGQQYQKDRHERQGEEYQNGKYRKGRK